MTSVILLIAAMFGGRRRERHLGKMYVALKCPARQTGKKDRGRFEGQALNGNLRQVKQNAEGTPKLARKSRSATSWFEALCDTRVKLA